MKTKRFTSFIAAPTTTNKQPQASPPHTHTSPPPQKKIFPKNLYTNNKEYKKIFDQASALGSYIDNMDAHGGPQTAEGKANYRKAVQDLEKLEAELERMWNEDWE